MDWIAIVSVLVSGAVGVAGVRAGMVSAREARQSAERMAGEEREHLERMARIERVQPRRAETYLELLALLNHVMEIVDRTQPIIEPMPAPPDPPDEERLRMNQARIGAFGSPEVKASNPCGSGGSTLKFIGPMSEQSRSGGGGGMQKSG
jgi:hypothetical protein